MAHNTDMRLRNQMVYSVYVRSHSPEGTFAGVVKDLDRIRALGTDIVWLLPIHPVGKKNRKGALGSPYSVRDYRGVNPEYGTAEEFKVLCAEIHARGMRCMLDVVYNHTACDSVLVQEHPEWFYRLPNGEFGNRAGAWSDVADLDFTQRGLWDYLIDSLLYWVSLGVDGFRCDVASPVPVEFWREARRRVEEAKPGVVWLAESVHRWFVENHRQNGFACHSDAELYEAFDITYDYDIHDLYEGYFAGRNTLGVYLNAMRRQESSYAGNFIKLRFLENHDQPRAAKLLQDPALRKMWEAFCFFARGTTLLYAGQEADDAHLPSLFQKDPVDWGGLDSARSAWFAKLCALRRRDIVREGSYAMQTAQENDSVALLQYADEDGNALTGVFNLEQAEGAVQVPVADGIYANLLDGSTVEVKGGQLVLADRPIVMEGKRI